MVAAGGIAAQLTASGLSLPTAVAWLSVGVVLLALLQAAYGLFAVGLGALGLVAVLEMLQGSSPTVAAPLYGGALLAAAEFGYWSLEVRMTVPQSGALTRRRTEVIVSLVVVGVGVSALLVAILGLVGTLDI